VRNLILNGVTISHYKGIRKNYSPQICYFCRKNNMFEESTLFTDTPYISEFILGFERSISQKYVIVRYLNDENKQFCQQK
jgi:hypothetical protein